MRVILPYHLGSGNRGCEGIVRGISNILGLKENELVMFDISKYDLESDKNVGLDKIGQLEYDGSFGFNILRFFCRVLKKFHIRYPYLYLLSRHYISNTNKDDVIFITGGDIYCYKGEYVLPNLIVKMAKKKGIKCILLGASLEDKFLNDDVISGIKQYNLIISRETLSAKNLLTRGVPTVVFPDPAFSLSSQEVALPDYFNKKEIIGINFSPFTNISEYFKANMDTLIEYVISKGMEVCLIPHVFWKGQDDRTAIEVYKNKDKVHILDSEKYSYLQIRYIISKCKIFIGGRTHAVISAYSTKTPCIALGYSIKAKGIALDIGMPEYTLVDSTNFEGKDTLLNAFKMVESNIEGIEKVYQKMDAYCLRTFEIKEYLNRHLDNMFL